MNCEVKRHKRGCTRNGVAPRHDMQVRGGDQKMVYKSVNGAWTRANGCENGWEWKRGEVTVFRLVVQTTHTSRWIRKACNEGSNCFDDQKRSKRAYEPENQGTDTSTDSSNQRAAKPLNTQGQDGIESSGKVGGQVPNQVIDHDDHVTA